VNNIAGCRFVSAHLHKTEFFFFQCTVLPIQLAACPIILSRSRVVGCAKPSAPTVLITQVWLQIARPRCYAFCRGVVIYSAPIIGGCKNWAIFGSSGHIVKSFFSSHKYLQLIKNKSFVWYLDIWHATII
jgi:hypothetical protein